MSSSAQIPKDYGRPTARFEMRGQKVSLDGVNGPLRLWFENGMFQSPQGYGATHRYVTSSTEGFPLIYCDHSYFDGVGMWWIIPKDRAAAFEAAGD